MKKLGYLFPSYRDSLLELIPQHFQPAEVLGKKVLGHGDTDSNKVDPCTPAQSDSKEVKTILTVWL